MKHTQLFWYIVTLFTAGWLRLSAVEIPRRADDFVDAMGINAHIDVDYTIYNEAIIGQLGIRHFRSNIRPIYTTSLWSRLTGLYANYGARSNVVCETTSFTPIQYRDLVKAAMFESVEGLNEPDVSGPRSYLGLTDNWVTQSYPATLAFQQDLFNAMSGDATTAAKPVLSPALANPANSRYLRSVAADIIAMHSYPAQQMPTGNFLTSFTIQAAQLMATPGNGVLPLISTETGYKSSSVATDISNLAAAKYIPRTFAEYFRLGVARTYLFEVADEPNVYNYGLLDGAYQPKPAYTTVKNLIGLLRESVWNTSTKTFATPSFNPGVLDYTMTVGSPNVHHILLQKSNGSLYLMLWQEVPSYNLTTHADISNPTVPVNLAFNVPIASAALYQLQSTTPIATYGATQSLTINVPDEVVILQLTPGTVATGVDPAVSLNASDASAVVTPLQTGAFSVSRTGSTAAPLNVNFSIGGTATDGVDYSAVAGSVQIPAGSAAANITVTPLNPLIAGRKAVILTLTPNASYLLATASSSSVYINTSRTVVADFESSVSGWTGNNRSKVSWDVANADTGIGALKWVYTDDGIERWANMVTLTFAAAQDWSAVSRIEFRIKEDGSNATADIGKPIYFNWYNNGINVGGSKGVTKIPLGHESGYRTVSIDLGGFPRDKLTSLYFYVDGVDLSVGTHTFYIDNLTAITDTNGVLDDFEQADSFSWSGSPHSAVQLDGQNADTGLKALKWTFTDVTTDRWNNYVMLNFQKPQDLTRYSTLCLRFKEDPANPSVDSGKIVYFDWANNGKRASNGSGVASFPLKGVTGYRTVELSLAEFNRDKVNYLIFYVDGDALSSGKHIWYLDNITAY